jgi:hypothetical protein
VLSKPSFDDRSLAASFYGALLRHFCNSFDSSTQALLQECRFGIAPSPSGVKTFFIVAPSVGVAEQLIERTDSILKQVSRLVAGVERTAICAIPPTSQEDGAALASDSRQLPSKLMLGKIFSNSCDTGSLN